MTRFFVSLFHFLVIALALIIIFSSFLFFSSNPQILFFIEPSGLNSDTRIIWGSIFGIFFGILIVVVFFGTLLVSLEINHNIRKILEILEIKKNITDKDYSNETRTPPQI